MSVPAMILWTIQPSEVWRILQTDGVFRLVRKIVERNSFLGDDACWRSAYSWMIDQMRSRLPHSPPNEDSFPIWAWFQWMNAGKRRPDLRHRQYRSVAPSVRIELEINDDLVLPSDFEQWHFALNYWYLPASERDHDDFAYATRKRKVDPYEQKSVSDNYCHQRIVKSWERMFKLDWTDEYIAHPRSEKSIQATFWQLRMHMVRSVTYFGAKQSFQSGSYSASSQRCHTTSPKMLTELCGDRQVQR